MALLGIRPGNGSVLSIPVTYPSVSWDCVSWSTALIATSNSEQVTSVSTNMESMAVALELTPVNLRTLGTYITVSKLVKVTVRTRDSEHLRTVP